MKKSFILMALAATILLLAGCQDYSDYEKVITGAWESYETVRESGDGSSEERINKIYVVECLSDKTWHVITSKGDETLYEGTWEITGVKKSSNSDASGGTIITCELYKKDSKESIGSIRWNSAAAEDARKLNADNYPNVETEPAKEGEETDIEELTQHLHVTPWASYFTVEITDDDGSIVKMNCEKWEWRYGEDYPKPSRKS